MSAADLTAVEQSVSHEWLTVFVRHFGEAKFIEAAEAYERIADLGRRRWSELRRLAEYGADAAYYQLRERVVSLGAEAIRRLPTDEGLRLIQDPDAREEFRWKAGVEALSAEERQRVGTPDELRRGADRDRFVDQQGWSSLSESERAELGAPAALGMADTPEKMAFLDRVGLSLAHSALKAAVQGLDRKELGNPEAFKAKYGRPIAEDYLKRSGLPATVQIAQCLYAAEERLGSLFKGAAAHCQIDVAAPRGPANILVSLERRGRVWTILGVSPMPYEVW